MSKELLTIKQASEFASNYLKTNVTASNILYLVQYGRIRKIGDNGSTLIDKKDLIKYYKEKKESDLIKWASNSDEEVNWNLAFKSYKEKETTKHVHRLHPYKGKFIPQLVEYFLNNEVDNFKTQTYFSKGDIILDPFSGSGTTLVQANELNIHAIGIDISYFNTMIGNIKMVDVDFNDLNSELIKITAQLQGFVDASKNIDFDNDLSQKLKVYNKTFFPSPDFKIDFRENISKMQTYALDHEKKFIKIFNHLRDKYNINIYNNETDTFLDEWYVMPIRSEIKFVQEQINNVKNSITRDIIKIIFSRTVRSCRATHHADLASLKKPLFTTYFCRKHGKICKPLFTILGWWNRYCKDTISRFKDFSKLKTNTHQICLQGDSRSIDIFSSLKYKNSDLYNLSKKNKIKGIFTSPPYVGLIDYHEQHAYSYELFEYPRNDEHEIGPLYNGQGKQARISYIDGISSVLNNCKHYLQEDFDIFIVANDKYKLYPIIAEKSGMQIVNQFTRPVLNRTEKSRSAYVESIFHLKIQ